LLYQLSYALDPTKRDRPPPETQVIHWTGSMRLGTPLSLAATSLALLVAASPCVGQTPADSDRWQVTMGEGQVLWDVRLMKLAGDSLYTQRGDSVAVVPVARITELRLIKKSEMQVGGPAGGAMGALMGSDDEVYDLTTLEFPERLRAVQKILLYHPPDSTTSAR